MTRTEAQLEAQLEARTKIVATLGPASDDADTIQRLLDAGVDVFRLNMAHGDRPTHEQLIATIRELTSQRAAVPKAILIDLAGPKLRLGQLVEDPYECKLGESVQFIRGDSSQVASEFVSNFPGLIDLLGTGDEILLADGNVQLTVTEKQADSVSCRVTQPGALSSRQGINLPGALAGLPALTDHDRDCVRWAATQEIDFLSLSFVQRADDIHDLKALMQEAGLDIPVIAKIEKREALTVLESIIEAADGAMVARGDLGVEIDVARVPLTQKRIIQLCNEAQKPVIVATEMLDSMKSSPRPTRAEATDVANAVLDGADACMLSGETAIGEYPAESVATMNRLMTTTEELLRDRPTPNAQKPNTTGALPITSAVVYGAGQIARRLGAALVVITTRSGATALTKSSFRDFVPTVAVSTEQRTLRRSALYWGIRPIQGAPCDSLESLRSFIFKWGRKHGILNSGDHVVFVAGRDTGQLSHNSVSVYEVD